jgi:hypothetical protein
MARVWPSQPFEAIHGSIGRITIRTSVRVGVACVKSGNRAPRTALQLTAARAAKRVGELWGAMTDAQRQAWDDLAAQLEYIPDPEVIGRISGFGVYSGHARRWLLLGTTVPNSPTAFGGQIPDPPWWKIYPENPVGRFRLFASPRFTLTPPGDARWLLYAGNARPAAREAYRRDERFRVAYTDASIPTESAPALLTVTSTKPFRAGDWCNFRGVCISDVGWTSRTFGWSVRSLDAGRSVAGIVWTDQILSQGAGIELTAAGLLRVWSFDYPTGVPDELDLAAGGGLTVGDAYGFFSGRFPFDRKLINAGLLSRSWTTLTPFPPRRMLAKDACWVIDTTT